MDLILKCLLVSQEPVVAAEQGKNQISKNDDHSFLLSEPGVKNIEVYALQQ